MPNLASTGEENSVPTEIAFEVQEDEADGGYTAAALGHDIFTEADTLPELRDNVREAVHCHFGDGAAGDAPSVIRLHLATARLAGTDGAAR